MPIVRKDVREGRACAVQEIADRLFKGDDVVADPVEFRKVLRWHGLAEEDGRSVALGVFERVAQRAATLRRVSQPTDAQYREAARALKQREGEVEIDPDAAVSADRGPDHEGAYVAAWVWVTDEEARS